MGVNKVIYNDKVLIDLTSDTVDASSLLKDKTAHGKNGAKITGTLVMKWGSINGTISDQTDLNSILVNKATKSELNSKVSKTEMNTALNAKADKTAVQDSLNLKVDKTSLVTSLAEINSTKATKTELQTAMNSIINRTDIQNAFAEKVDKIEFQQTVNNLNDMAHVEDAPDDGQRYVRKHGVWMLESIGGATPSGGSGSGSGSFDISQLGALAGRDYINYDSDYLKNKPVFGSLATKNISVTSETLVFGSV